VSRLWSLVSQAGWRPWHYALLLLVNIHVIASGMKAGANDWQYVFYPWAEALRYSILRYGQIPWWNPWSAGGQPLMTDPQIAVFMPDSLILLGFGAVVGFKILIVLYQFAAYEGSRRLCRHLFGGSPFIGAISVIPAIVPALPLHFNEGHLVFLPFYLVPWLLYYGLTWHQSPRRALGLGIVVGLFLLGYIHYTVIMAFTILGFVIGATLIRQFRTREIWPRAALVVSTALGLGLFRIAMTFALISRFPRVETEHYPVVASISEVIRTLVEPLQHRNTPGQIAALSWWELGSYVGFPVLFLAYEGLRRGPRRLWPIYVGAVVCLVLAWNNRDAPFPSTWLHEVPPWKSMIVITRWRLFACFFLLLGAVHGLGVLRRSGRPRLAWGLALLIVADLGFHAHYASRGTFEQEAPPMVRGTDPPPSIRSDAGLAWRDVRANYVALESECSLLGWNYRARSRRHVGTPGYTGDFSMSKELTLDEWTPNRIRMHGVPGAEVQININPSNYWLLNGKRLFPDYRPIEPELPFRFRVPPSGKIELVPRPPHATELLLAQAAFALAALLLYLRLARPVSGRPLGGGGAR
jgi:hypothetical protein